MTIKHLTVFSFFHFLLWSAISLIYFATAGFYTDALGLAFTAVFIPGHIVLFALALWALCFLFSFSSSRVSAVACTLWGGLFSVFFALDIFVFSQYRFHISMAMLQLFFGPAGREIFVFPFATYLTAAVAVFLLFFLSRMIYRLSAKVSFGKRTFWSVTALILLCVTAYNALYAWGKFMMVPSIISQRGTLPYAHPLSANRRLRKWGFEPKKNPYILPNKDNITYPLNPLVCNPKNKKNILIILVESWRSDSLKKEVMPLLLQRAKQKGMFYFSNHLSGGNATEAGVFSLFYSMPYSYWNDITGQQIPPVLITEAQKLGYVPAIYSSGKLNSPTFHQNIFSSVKNLRLESKGKTKWERDIQAIEDFEQFLNDKNAQEPFFGFIFLDAPHGMEYPKEDAVIQPAAAKGMNYLLLTKKTDPTPYLNRYFNSLHFTDRMIERIFADLEKKNLLKDTVIILTGDHGQEINDTRNNFWGHNSNFAKYQTHVPLFVWYPELEGGQKDYRTNHYDIVPLLMNHILACQNPLSDYSIGLDLLDDTPRPFSIISSYTKKAIQTENKLTVIDAYGSVELYDEDFTPINDGAKPEAVTEALKTFSQFYK